MAQRILAAIRDVYSNQGVQAVAALGFKKIVRLVATVGSLYFLERDLSLPMPLLEPSGTMVPRGHFRGYTATECTAGCGPS